MSVEGCQGYVVKSGMMYRVILANQMQISSAAHAAYEALKDNAESEYPKPVGSVVRVYAATESPDGQGRFVAEAPLMEGRIENVIAKMPKGPAERWILVGVDDAEMVEEVRKLRARVKALQRAAWVYEASSPKSIPKKVGGHFCVSSVKYCYEDTDGALWAGDGERESPVNFCPFCGKRADVQKVVPWEKINKLELDAWMDEMRKSLDEAEKSVLAWCADWPGGCGDREASNDDDGGLK